MSMLETILAGLIVASVSGAAFVAYNHPTKFRKVSNSFSIGLVIIFVIFLAWYIGYAGGIRDIQNIDPLNTKISQAATEKIKPQDQKLGWGFLVFIGTLIYLYFLESFVAGLKEPSREKAKSN